MITIYENMGCKTPHHITVEQALDRIKNGKSKDTVERIRKGETELKNTLPCVIFAGVVEGDTRRDKDVVKHSSHFVLDFDHVDPHQKINQLKNDQYIRAAWVSPSGDGVKALVRCSPSLSQHGDMYSAFSERYPELDTTSKNLARLCFESYDPNIYTNHNSSIWTRTKTEAEVARERAERKDRRNVQLLGTAVAMVRSSVDGEKHDQLLKAARLLGGYVAAGRIDEKDAMTTLLTEIKLKNPANLNQAKQTIKDGLEYGKRAPLHEAKKIEKSQEFLKRDDGEFSFIADKREMDAYEQSVIDGTVAMGLSCNIPALDKYWMFKYNSLDWFSGLDNSGKTFLLWYLAVLEAAFNGITILVGSFENNDGELRKKLKEFYIGKPIKEMDSKERQTAGEFVDKHFKLFSSKHLYTWEDFLLRAEVIYDEGWEFDLLIAEPFNAMDIPNGLDEHRHNLKATNMLRVFKESFSSVWVADHVNSSAGRNKDKDGFIKVPWKSDVSGGQLKANKVDAFCVVHRVLNDPARKYLTELHVQKVRSKETGGEPTNIDEPVLLRINQNYCGYTCGGVDPIAEYWQRKNGTPPPPKERPSIGSWADLESTDNAPF